MLRISWTDLKTNDEILALAGERRNLMNIIRKRQLRVFGHVMRRDGLENFVTTGIISVSIARGRPREKYTHD